MNKLWLGLALIIVFLATRSFYSEALKVVSTRPTSWSEDKKADCAVVLTGGPYRINEGISLLSQGMIQRLIISGVHPGSGLREIFPLWPLYGNIDEKNVILEKSSGTTYGNASQSLALVEALNCRDILLVTSRLHMYRAHRTFKKQFPEDYPIYKRPVISGQLRPDFMKIFIESLKSLFYSIWAY